MSQDRLCIAKRGTDMLSVILWLLLAISLLVSFFTGNLSSLGTAALEGAQSAITLTLSMAGALCLWSGLSEVLMRAGMIYRLSRYTRPLLRRLLRLQKKDPKIDAALSENLIANLLGLGNAATPAGLRAVSLLREAGDQKAVSRLVLLNTCSIQLIPFTAASLRISAGAMHPFDILPVVLIASAVSLITSFSVYRSLTHD